MPTSAPELLGTAHHLLLNELRQSPHTLLDCVRKLSQQAYDLDTGTLKSSTSTIILYVTRLCCRIVSYVSLLLDYDCGVHETIVGKPCRDMQCAVRPALHCLLRSTLHSL